MPGALAEMKSSRAQGLVVYRLDRLARDLVIQETLRAEVRRMTCEVFSTASSESAYLVDDPNDPARKLIRQVLGAVAEYDRSMIALEAPCWTPCEGRTRGLRDGSPPMGYRAVAGALAVDEVEAQALKRAHQLRAAGMSLRGIAEVLHQEGHRAKRGGAWHPTTLARALRPQTKVAKISRP